ncbi:hypothetical protein CFC21_035948 [Triticum aestivum]|uniref:Diacylglycerol O-acyltransferase n=3 Tax=Triticum TaxID=4564 RepID=A0A9R0VL17_TRITD|nr:wax ester synthase/diacylglycerol acyltransferase 11-like [Triticum aestivum]KAF7023441.1 hypothetical protein CFC21_035948 [Triticum aestivum]VAH63239.1 unnamed protein product [Triticum turgidum subsp. durum]
MDLRRGSMLRQRKLAIETDSKGERATREGEEEDEPVSPVGRLFLEPRFCWYIVCVLGLGAPVDLAGLRAGIEATLLRHPRFCSVVVMDELEEGTGPKWVRTTVELDEHIIVPNLDPTAMLIEPDRTLEDYLSSLSTLPMDHSRPLWEFHVLDFPTSEAAAALAFRAHHSLGDGTSLLSLLVASAGSSKVLPTTAPRRVSTIKALSPRSPSSADKGAMVVFTVWIMSLLLIVWHTIVDIACFVATAASMLRDPPALFKGADGVEFRPKCFLNRKLSLDDIKYVKSVMCCTVNDVLLGVISAALSRYYFRKTGETGKRNIKVRSTFIVNLRKMTGLHTLASMMKSGEDNDVKWGNQLGYMLLPFHIEKHDDPLKYVEKAMRVAHRKKSSMESVFTNWSASMIQKIFGSKATASLCYALFKNTTILFSNMVGPTEQVALYGHPILYIAPSIYGQPHALTIHYQSYMNIVKLVLAIDEAQLPNVDGLLEDFIESLKLIREAASGKPRVVEERSREEHRHGET